MVQHRLIEEDVSLQKVMVFLYADETTDSVTCHTDEQTLKTYALGANKYTTIIFEADCAIVASGTSREVTWRIYYGASVVFSHVMPTSTIASSHFHAQWKVSGQQQNAATLKLTVQGNAIDGSVTLEALSERVYAVI